VRLGLTIADLAMSAGVPPWSINDWETGRARPSEAERTQLERALALAEASYDPSRDRSVRRQVWVDENGVAWVDDTNRKVKEIVEEHVAFAWTPIEICAAHRDLTLPQVHAALAYYYDHRELVDAELAADAQVIESLRHRMRVASIRVRNRRAASE
jgi:uncharacterized protein (DUF433 family)